MTIPKDAAPAGSAEWQADQLATRHALTIMRLRAVLQDICGEVGTSTRTHKLAREALAAAPPPSVRGGRATVEMVNAAKRAWADYWNTTHVPPPTMEKAHEAALNAALGSAIEGEKTEGDLPDGVGPVKPGADR